MASTVRIAFAGPLETLDPIRANAMWTQAQAGPLFDQLYGYDYLARPARLVPLAASGMPRVSADGREITVRIRPGILFTPHPAFDGKPRELGADDFIYSVKRIFDPALHSPAVGLVKGMIAGLDERSAEAARATRPFDYRADIEGLKALDRYTVRIRLNRPDPAFVYLLASPIFSIVPREAVEADGDEFARRPTGSGPYRVAEFQPGTRLAVERNPLYRTVRWEDVAPDSASTPEWDAFRGRTFPLADRVEFIYIPEPSTGLLALETGEIDLWPVTESLALERNRLKPALAKRGFKLVRGSGASPYFLIFNMRDPQIGGPQPAHIALRRALAMSIDDDEYIRVMANGNGNIVHHPIPSSIEGHDPTYRRLNGHDPATANALLDRMGYRKGSDGSRRLPDGGELVLTVIVGTSSEGRRWSEFLKRSFERVGVRTRFDPMPAGERLQRVATCRFQMTTMDWGFDWPDGSNLMLALYGKTSGSAGLACMQDPVFDAAFEELAATPLGGARAPLYRRMVERIDALMPVRLLPDSDTMYLTAPDVRGIAIHPAAVAIYPYLDVVSHR